MLKVLHHFFILAIENTDEMRVVIQRVSQASVTVEGEKISEIGKGMLILVGIEDSDNQEDIGWLANKIVQLRIFRDEHGVMNLSIKDIDGDILVVSQFTLHASTKKGNRPSYIRASKPDFAVPMYEKFIAEIEKASGKKTEAGIFGAMMNVALVNDGPVTIIIDTKNKDY
ncbi:MAG: D-tyrosyl-tRNA(Tyr) [Prolixibacteraceae bacterium]|nr:MAG: D-tyrosyl-tRNA(Tyr) [Prolixibacteraceae bacterium]